MKRYIFLDALLNILYVLNYTIVCAIEIKVKHSIFLRIQTNFMVEYVQICYSNIIMIIYRIIFCMKKENNFQI